MRNSDTESLLCHSLKEEAEKVQEGLSDPGFHQNEAAGN